MTAIAGLWCFDGRPDAADGVQRMLKSQELYGPHHSAVWADGAVALGRQLFRILPEDVHDKGMAIDPGGQVLAGDVRLDNRDELLPLLNLAPERGRIMSDAAILLAAIVRWDEDAMERLQGDFSFAAFDPRRRRLLLARDFLGARPLHIHRGSNFLAFASMPKGLHALPGVPYAPDEERAAEFLALMPESGPRSFFAGIERIEAGHLAVVTPAGMSVRRWWQPVRRTLWLGSDGAYEEGLRHHMDEAVRVRLRGTTHVATHLSGGFDSASVTATAARLLGNGTGQVTAFTSVPRKGYDGAVPRGRFGDERPQAAAVAALHPNIDHQLIRTQDRTPLDTLDRDFFLYEKPVLNLCNGIWSSVINDAARDRKLTVLLTGQMGNMSISYTGHELLAELLVAGRWLKLAGVAASLLRNRTMRPATITGGILGPFVPGAVWRGVRRVLRGGNTDIRHYTAINDARLAALDLPAKARALDWDFSYRPWRDGVAMRLWGLRRVDPGNYRKGILGGWGIDARDPTADRRLIEFCLSVPTEQFLRRGVPRSLARRAFADRLPPALLAETRKGLQAIDWHENLFAGRQAAADEIERLAACVPATRALDVPRMRALIRDWPAGGWHQNDIMQTYRLALLRGLSMGHFLRKAAGGNQ